MTTLDPVIVPGTPLLATAVSELAPEMDNHS